MFLQTNKKYKQLFLSKHCLNII